MGRKCHLVRFHFEVRWYFTVPVKSYMEFCLGYYWGMVRFDFYSDTLLEARFELYRLKIPHVHTWISTGMARFKYVRLPGTKSKQTVQIPDIFEHLEFVVLCLYGPL